MNIDFSTITPLGVIALFVVCIVLIFVFLVLMKAIKTLRVKTDNATIEIGKNTEKISESVTIARSSGITVGRDVIKRQSNLAKHHILEMAGDLEKVIFNTYDLSQEGKNHARLILNLFLSELKYQVLNNFTENHIGSNDIEIREYTKIREREYIAFARTFVNSYAWLFPTINVLDFFENIPDGYFEEKLFTIFKDGKDLEKNHTKGNK